MRLAERTLQEVQLLPRICHRGALGGSAEAFSEEAIMLRASVLPDGGRMEIKARGISGGERLRLLTAADAPVHTGDCICMMEKRYRVVSVASWTAHRELLCEEMR